MQNRRSQATSSEAGRFEFQSQATSSGRQVVVFLHGEMLIVGLYFFQLFFYI